MNQRRPLTVTELRTLLSDKTDASAVLLRIDRDDGTLERLLENKSPDQVKLIVKVMAKGVENTHNAQPEAVNSVLTKFKDSGDFHDKLQISFCTSGKDAEYIRAVLVLLKLTLQRYPNNAAKMLAHSCYVLESVIEQKYQDNADLKEEMAEVRRMILQPQRVAYQEEDRRHHVIVQNDRDVDPNLFRELTIIPTARDFDPAQDIVYRANKIQGAFDNINDYLDIQVKLWKNHLVFAYSLTNIVHACFGFFF